MLLSKCFNLNLLQPKPTGTNSLDFFFFFSVPGRWNHNPNRIQELIHALSTTFNIQLKHDAEEKDRQDHGYVTVVDAEGNVVAHSEKLQHNQNYSDRKDALAAMAATVMDLYGGKDKVTDSP